MHWTLSDKMFQAQFENCSLDAQLFDHEAHLRLAWLLISELGLDKAEMRIQDQLKNYVAHLGAEEKYNTTVTIAAMKAVYHFMKRSKTRNFKDFITENSQLKTNFKGLIESHYSYDIFNLVKAKSEFLEPDLSPFN